MKLEILLHQFFQEKFLWVAFLMVLQQVNYFLHQDLWWEFGNIIWIHISFFLYRFLYRLHIFDQIWINAWLEE